MNVTAGRGLVPPRPNLGPEPWSETQPTPVVYVALLLPLLVILSCAILYGSWRRRRIGRAKEKQPPLRDEQLDASPRAQLIGLSGTLRAALTDRFGISYRARTVEELSADGALGELLGAQFLEHLIDFLDQADELKFAPARTPHDQRTLEQELIEWEPRVRNLATRIREKRSADSEAKRTGRPWGLVRRRNPESERR